MKPIIFNSESVRAILDGRKTQTRRVIKPQPESQGMKSYGEAWEWRKNEKDWFSGATIEQIKGHAGLKKYCPYGVPGDKLWVRETWKPFITANSPTSLYDNKAGYGVRYKADGARALEGFSANIITDLVAKSMRWRSPIYMPRWASRITLELKDVRVERVQDIKPIDTVAEGAYEPHYNYTVVEGVAAILEYEQVWNSINKKRGFGWDINPWVWALEFEVI